MGAESSVDQLVIEIKGKADSAKSSLSGLASDLRKVGNATEGVSSKLNGVSQSLDSFSRKGPAINTINGLATALNKLNGVRISSTIGTQLDNIKRAMSGMGDTSGLTNAIGAISSLSHIKISSSVGNQLKKVADGIAQVNAQNVDATKIDSLVQALNGLSAISKNSLNSTVNALKKVPEAAKALNETDFDQLRRNVDALRRSLGALPASASRASSGMRGTASAARGLGSSMDSAKSKADSFYMAMYKVARVAHMAMNISTIIGVFGGAANAIANVVDSANKYVEDMNLFNVAMGEYADSARTYANEVSALMGIEPQEWMRGEGTFATIAKGMGVASDAANTMSQQLTQLSYDLASFYNISVDDAMEKVQAGLVGQIRPLRELGFDLSEARLKEEAMAEGIDENIDSMTQAEKAMLRYKAMLSQVSWAQGDMARTLDSPANALRIFKSQLHQAAVSIGTVFLPMIKAILPVATAAAKVVATLANMIANLTGGKQIASVDYSGGGVSPTTGGGDESALPADTGTGGTGGSGESPTAKKYKGIGDAAKKAADNVKELKRQVLSFDEINKFSDTSSSSGSGTGSGNGGSGNGGSGGSGSGSGAGGGAGSLPIQTYNFLGNNDQLNDIVNKMLEFARRIAKALDPLVRAVQRIVNAIKKQFEGLDFAGAVENAFAGFTNLLSNFVRNCVEIIGQLVVAFNFPATLAYAFDFAAQLCLTLSQAINDLGAFIRNFNTLSVTPLVAWIGDKLRGAIAICIDELSQWQTWLRNEQGRCAELGTAAGSAAGFVFHLAQAVADGAFQVAAGVFTGIGNALRYLLGLLLNSGAAKTMAADLGATLAFYAITSGIDIGLRGIGDAFRAMSTVIVNAAAKIEGGTNQAKTGIDGLSPSMEHARSGVGDFKAALGLLSDTLQSRFSGAAHLGRDATNAVRDALTDVTWKAQGAGEGFTILGHHFDTSRTAARLHKEQIDRLKTSLHESQTEVQRASKALETQRTRLNEAKAAAEQDATVVNRLKVSTEEMKTKQQEANLQIAQGREKMAAARLAARNMSTAEQQLALRGRTVATAEREATTQIVAGIGKKGAATIASKILAGAEWGAAAAAKGLKLAMDAIPGVALATALGIVMDVLSPLIDKVTEFIKGLLGISDANDDVSDTTQEATEVLSQEQQQVQDNKDAIDRYCQSHDSFKDALEASGHSSDDFAQHLADIDETFDDLEQSQDQYVQNTINGFDKIDESTGASLSDVNSNLASNNQAMADWSTDLQGFYDAAFQKFGDSADQMVQYLEDAGPSKMGKALKEFMEDPSSEASQQFLDNIDTAMKQTDPTVANALKYGNQAEGAAGDKGTSVGRAFTDGVDSTQDEAAQASSDVDDATVQKFGSHYNEAKDAGRNLAGGFGDGVREASADAVKPAEQVGSDVVKALNGGKGYADAVSAGRNVVGGFGDGIRQAVGQATSAAQDARSSTVRALNGGNGYNEARSAGANLMGGYGDGLRSAVDTANNVASDARNTVVRSLNGGSGYNQARSAGANMMGGFADGLRSAIGQAQSAGRQASESARQGMGSNYWGAYDSGRNEMGGFIDGLRDGMGNQAWWKGRDAAVSAQQGAGSNYWGAYDAGKNFAYGFGNGIYDTSWYGSNAGRNVAIKAYNAAMRALDEHSPSKKMHKVGAYFSMGLANGISDTSKAVEKSAEDVAERALGTASSITENGRELGRAFGGGFTDSAQKGISDTNRAVSEAARSYSFSTSLAGAPSDYAHGGVPQTSETELAATIAAAVQRGIVSATPLRNDAGSDGTTEVVLRLDSEVLARGVMKGKEKMDARMGISLG